MSGPKQREVQALAAEESNLLRRRATLEVQTRDLVSQAKVNRAEMESIDRRLLSIRGRLEGVDLGSAMHQELMAAAIERKTAEKEAEDAEAPAPVDPSPPKTPKK